MKAFNWRCLQQWPAGEEVFEGRVAVRAMAHRPRENRHPVALKPLHLDSRTRRDEAAELASQPVYALGQCQTRLHSRQIKARLLRPQLNKTIK